MKRVSRKLFMVFFLSTFLPSTYASDVEEDDQSVNPLGYQLKKIKLSEDSIADQAPSHDGVSKKFDAEQNEAQKVAEKNACMPWLNTEVLAQVLTLLSHEEYKNAGLVCKRFYRITRNPSWLHMHIERNLSGGHCLGLNLNMLRELAEIFSSTNSHDFSEKRKNQMILFEQTNLSKTKISLSVFKFYYNILASIDFQQEKSCRSYPELVSEGDKNKYDSQKVLKKIDLVLCSILSISGKEGFPFVRLHSNFKNSAEILKPLISCTQQFPTEIVAIRNAVPVMSVGKPSSLCCVPR